MVWKVKAKAWIGLKHKGKNKKTQTFHFHLLACWLCLNAYTDYNIYMFVSFILKVRVNDPAHDDGHNCNELHTDNIINQKQVSKYTID
jgi:hypothetical protein